MQSAVSSNRSLVGIVLVDKPQGLTSNRVLQRVKRLFRAKKAGHTGTLDPIATGMLPICFGAATKISGMLLDASKRYRVVARFGTATDTGDATGEEIARLDSPALEAGSVAAAASAWVGRRQQTPPMYSAVKHDGRRLYELARQGLEVERPARDIEIFGFQVEAVDWPRVTFMVHCSKGTYIRTLISDLAHDLGTVAHVVELRRLTVGPFEESQMVSLEALEQAASHDLAGIDRWLMPPDVALADRPAVCLEASDCLKLRQGQPVIGGETVPGGSIRLYTPEGSFVGLGECDLSGLIRPTRIFPV